MGEIISIGMAGLGNVGAGVYKNLERNSGLLTERTGHRFEVSRVAVRDISRQRDVEVPPAKLTREWRELVTDPGIQIIVESDGRGRGSL